MKAFRKFSLVICFIIFASVNIYSQSGKPQYNLRCEREGLFLGNIKLELFPIIAPLHTKNFDSLVSIQFYDTTAFHRVVPNFVIQGGDPNSRHGDPSTWGYGDSTQTTVPAEFSNVNHARGILGAARSEDINSATSQFFVNVVENGSLNGRYTAYGRVYDGMNIADSIVNSPTVPGTERPLKKIEMFITHIGFNNNVPEIPTLISPQDGLKDVMAQLTFQWNSVPEGVLYRLQIAKDSLFTDIVYDYDVGRTSRTITSFEQGQVKHFWRVSANNGGHIGGFSSVRSFTTGITSPNLIEPLDSTTGVVTNPIFKWNPVEGAISYRIQVATATSFLSSQTVVNQTVTGDTYQASNLLPDKRYYWRVRGITSTYEGLYSPIRTFTTGSSTNIEENNIVNDFALEQNYPNPFNPVTTIKFAIPSNVKPSLVSGRREMSNVKLIVYDIIGNVVATLVNEEKQPGTYEVKFDASGLSSGMYFYRLTTGNFIDTKKMILLR